MRMVDEPSKWCLDFFLGRKEILRRRKVTQIMKIIDPFFLETKK